MTASVVVWARRCRWTERTLRGSVATGSALGKCGLTFLGDFPAVEPVSPWVWHHADPAGRFQLLGLLSPNPLVPAKLLVLEGAVRFADRLRDRVAVLHSAKDVTLSR